MSLLSSSVSGYAVEVMDHFIRASKDDHPADSQCDQFIIDCFASHLELAN
jgi:hypothetical protein